MVELVAAIVHSSCPTRKDSGKVSVVRIRLERARSLFHALAK